ncbi:hypothetical protein RDWZM_002465 [Blomia tropicalis]|uniref:Uncharacterized protein n=1 Tax=Blomia tropicalis TaxID=40697 RepID=A0A9Q0MDJ1_BLOTA|nr:hypothetical protein BLOT_001769 [Blomia tropicalis]KAJ6223920.1 hypothetical protein RDWZM_002465 [Blomia tropicalis]
MAAARGVFILFGGSCLMLILLFSLSLISQKSSVDPTSNGVNQDDQDQDQSQAEADSDIDENGDDTSESESVTTDNSVGNDADSSEESTENDSDDDDITNLSTTIMPNVTKDSNE